MGGVRALRLLGYNPDVWHMNEGHSAFLTLERVRELVAEARPSRRPPKSSATTTFSPPTPPSRPATTSSRSG